MLCGAEHKVNMFVTNMLLMLQKPRQALKPQLSMFYHVAGLESNMLNVLYSQLTCPSPNTSGHSLHLPLLQPNFLCCFFLKNT